MITFRVLPKKNTISQVSRSLRFCFSTVPPKCCKDIIYVAPSNCVYCCYPSCLRSLLDSFFPASIVMLVEEQDQPAARTNNIYVVNREPASRCSRSQYCPCIADKANYYRHQHHHHQHHE